MNEFAKKTNITLVFGLSAQYGRETNHKSMNLSNIVNSIKYTKILNQLNDNASNLSTFEFDDESHASNFYASSQIICNTTIIQVLVVI